MPSDIGRSFRSEESKETDVLVFRTPILTKSFEQIAKELGRDEVAVAAMFYAQAKPSVSTQSMFIE